MTRNELQRNATSSGRGSALPAVTIVAEAFPETLSQPKRRAIVSLLIGTTATEAARQAGVTRETLWRWRTEDAEFIATLNGLRHEMAESVFDQVRALGPLAVATLRELLSNERTPAAVRLKVVQEIFDALNTPHTGPTDVRAAEVSATQRSLAVALGQRVPPLA